MSDAPSPTQKIIIFGFPHTGTTIFRNILGHCDDVDEMLRESNTAFKETNKKFVVCKFPFTWDQFLGDEYKDYVKIFIVRNPLWVFSSLNKRFSNNIPADHNMYSYFRVLDTFLRATKNQVPNTYLVRYEDMFDNNYAAMRNVFDSIGVEYTDRIFQNTEFKNVANFIAGASNTIPTEEPEHTSHNSYRAYQVNQPFVNNNTLDKLQLNHVQKHTLTTHPTVLQIYPDIKDTLRQFEQQERDKPK